MMGVSLYGGGLWHTWLDRELKMAGRLVVRKGDTVKTVLTNVPKPVACIPNLAIHLQTADERTAFKLDKETHLRPLLGLSKASAENTDKESVESVVAYKMHSRDVLNVLAE